VTTGISLDGSTGVAVGLGTSLDGWMFEVAASEEAGMTGTSELGKVSKEVEAT